MPRAVLAVLALLFVAACGGEETPKPPAAKATPDPVAQVRELAPKLVSRAGGYELCFENSTDRFIRAVFKGDRDSCGNLQRIIGPGTPKVLDVKVTGEAATATLAFDGSPIKDAYGTLGFVREGGVWKLDKLDEAFVRSTAVVSVRAISSGALTISEVQMCVAKQSLKLSEAAVRKYVYALLRVDDGAGELALRLVNKCPKEVAIFVSEEIALRLKTDGYSRKYVECVQPRLQGYLALTGIAPQVLSGSDDKDFGADAVGGLLAGIDEECRRFK